MRYSQLGAIFGHLIEKSNTKDLLKDYLTTLIQVAKLVDKRVIEVETLEHWHRLKVHRVPFMRYLEKGKIKLLCQKIGLFTRIRLKTTLQ